MDVENSAPWTKIVGTLQDGIYTANAYYYYNATTAGALALSTMLNALDGAGKSAAVLSINMAPRSMIVGAPLADGTRLAVNQATSVNKRVAITIKNSGSFEDVLGGTTYTPKNKKCYTHPYSYLMVTNNGGIEANYRYEWMVTSVTTDFLIKGDINPLEGHAVVLD